MNKIFKKIGTIASIGLVGMSLIGCSEEDATTPTNTPTDVSSDTSTTDLIVLKKLKVASKGNYEYALKGQDYIPNVTVTGVYSNLEEEDLTDLVEFSSVDTSTVGNKSVTVSYQGISTDYTVKVIEPTVTNMVCAYSGIKLNYNIGETFDSSGLYCYLYYKDDIKEETQDYSITIYDSNGNLYTSLTFTLTGTYTVKITYQTFQSEYPITVSNQSASNTNSSVTSITLDTTNTKLSYQAGEALSFDNLVVSGVTSSGNITLTDYTYELYNLSNSLVTNTTSLAVGNYTVKVIYGNNFAFYNITVTSDATDTFKVNFGISGAASSAQGYGYEVSLTRYQAVDPLELISEYIPSGYSFCGFGGTNGLDWDNPNPDTTYDILIKIYVCNKQSGKAHVCFVEDNYEYITHEYYTLNSTVTELPNYGSNSSYVGSSVLINWEVENKLSPVTGDCYIFPNKALVAGTLQPTIDTTSTGEVIINLGLSNDYTYSYYLELSDSNGNTQSITANSNNYQLTLNSSYTIKGKVVYNTSDGFCAKIVNCGFVNSYYESLTNLTEENVRIVTYSNGMVVGTQEYVDAAPEGYVFKALAIFDEDGNQVDIQEYNGGVSLTFYGIDEGNYRIDAYYDVDESESVSLLSYNTFGPDDYYGFHVVGFWIWFGHYPGQELCKVELVYQNDLLYTFYYGKGEYPNDVFKFILPHKYAGYKVIGSYDYVSEINEDQVWELIMVPYNSSKNTVFFLGQDHQEIIYSQVITSLDDIVYPSEEDLSYTCGSYYKYVFKEWSVPTNLSSTMYVYPRFTRTIIDENSCQYEPYVYVESNYLYFTYNKLGSSSYNKMKYYIKGGNYLTKTEVDSGIVDNIKPNTTYIVTLEYTFILSTLEEIKVEKELTFTTPQTTYTDDTEENIVIANITYASIYGDVLNPNIRSIRISNNSTSKQYRYLNQDTFGFSMLKVSTEYLITYYLYDSDGICYGYRNKVIKTDYMDEPVFDSISVTLENGFGTIIFKHKNAEELFNENWFLIDMHVWLPEFGFDSSINKFYISISEYIGNNTISCVFQFPPALDENGDILLDSYGNMIFYEIEGWNDIIISYSYDGYHKSANFSVNYEKSNITKWGNTNTPINGELIYDVWYIS